MNWKRQSRYCAPWALSVESRDPYTEGHCERLARHASELGRYLGLDQESIVALRRGGYLHDLGKISVPDEILKKGSNLTPEEWAIMKRHPATGEAICQPLKSLRLVLPIIRSHHEHSDGTGYPDGLHGTEIPLLARVLQVVDVYDALRTARPYKLALSHEQAAATMREEARSGYWDEQLTRRIPLHAEKTAASSVNARRERPARAKATTDRADSRPQLLQVERSSRALQGKIAELCSAGTVGGDCPQRLCQPARARCSRLRLRGHCGAGHRFGQRHHRDPCPLCHSRLSAPRRSRCITRKTRRAVQSWI